MSIAIKPKTVEPIAIKIAFCVISFQSLILKLNYNIKEFMASLTQVIVRYSDLYSQECVMTPLPATLKDLLSIRLPSL